MKLKLIALARPLAVAVNCLLPAKLIRKSVKLAVPLPAPVPRSRFVVPSSAPKPELKASETFKPFANPATELFPNVSCVTSAGCVPKMEPTVAAPGCVTNASFATPAALIAMPPEVVLVKMPLLKSTLMVVATLCDKLTNVATPLLAVTFKPPCKVPLPALRAAVTTVLLLVTHRFPNWSAMRIAGCWAKGAPAVATAEGCVWTTNWLAAAAPTAMPVEVSTSRVVAVKSIVMVSAS